MLIKHPKSFPLILISLIFLSSACASSPAESPGERNRTGIAELDGIIEKVLAGDTAGLRSLLEFTQTKCTNAEGLGGPPKCLNGEQEGTPVDVLPFLGPEGHFIRKADIASWQGIDASDLFAVYQVSDLAYSDENFPAGEYALVFIGDSQASMSVTLQVRRGRIVRIDDGFGYPPVIREDDVLRYLVPPIKTDP